MKEISKRRQLGTFRFIVTQVSSRDESMPPTIEEFTAGMSESHVKFIKDLVERMRTIDSDQDFTYLGNEKFQIHINRVISGAILDIKAEGSFL